MDARGSACGSSFGGQLCTRAILKASLFANAWEISFDTVRRRFFFTIAGSFSLSVREFHANPRAITNSPSD